MSETNGPGASAGVERERGGRGEAVEPGLTPGDPRKHAAELLEQSNRLMRVAHRMRREAYRLNESLGVPVRRRHERSRSSGRPESGGEESPAAQGRRFAPEHEAPEVIESAESTVGAANGLQISDGTRLMITNMATLGNDREEILTHMRDELGIADAEGILRKLNL
jgi:hypothetical protein